mmetsp:Transcript_17578/g.28449  ORF Transcript_17578/g.28449 Transcript_17578/m.28449 type:complete len:731 (-) Transcript_17578:1817-4009(-)
MLVVDVLYDFLGDPSDPSQITVYANEQLAFISDCGDGWTETSKMDGSASGAVPTSYLSPPYDMQQQMPAMMPSMGYGVQQSMPAAGYMQQPASHMPQQAMQYSQPPPQQYAPQQMYNQQPARQAPGMTGDSFDKYRKMQKAGLPEGAICQAAQRDAVQLPPDFFSNSPGNGYDATQQQQQPQGYSAPPQQQQQYSDPRFEKYRTMQKAGIVEGAIRQAAFRDVVELPADFFSTGPGSGQPAQDNAPAVDPALEKYVKMQKAGLPEGAIRQSAQANNVTLPNNFFSGGAAATLPASTPAPAPAAGGNPLLASIQGFNKTKLQHTEGAGNAGSNSGNGPSGGGGPGGMLAGISGFNRGNLKKATPRKQDPPPPASTAEMSLMEKIQAKALARQQRQEKGEGQPPARAAPAAEPEWMRKRKEIQHQPQRTAPGLVEQPAAKEQTVLKPQRAAPGLVEQPATQEQAVSKPQRAAPGLGEQPVALEQPQRAAPGLEEQPVAQEQEVPKPQRAAPGVVEQPVTQAQEIPKPPREAPGHAEQPVLQTQEVPKPQRAAPGVVEQPVGEACESVSTVPQPNVPQTVAKQEAPVPQAQVEMPTPEQQPVAATVQQPEPVAAQVPVQTYSQPAPAVAQPAAGGQPPVHQTAGPPQHAVPGRAPPGRQGGLVAAPSRAAPSRKAPQRAPPPAAPQRAPPSRAAPSRAAPSRAAPSRAAPGRAAPSRAAPGRAAPARRAPTRS